MFSKLSFIDTFSSYVAGGDMSRPYVDIFAFERHVFAKKNRLNPVGAGGLYKANPF
jgi:hypothetical protein